ncbi:acyl-CoA N-acyltransferase [Delphinella strobiligena]|nr:acyl-CoA N-acyltransferase [Delphinella strobiligena]
MIELSPLQESEIDEYSRLCFTIFRESDSSLSKCFYPNNYISSVSAHLNPKIRKTLVDPNAHLFLLRDGETKQVIGAAHWEVRQEEKPLASIIQDDERARREREAAAPVEGVNHVAINACRDIQAQCRREIMGGRPHVYLAVLVVSEQYQRRGVGSAAMKWGLDRADELGLPAYLESSRQGRGLYERWGFRVVKLLPFDAREYGHSASADHYVMVKASIYDGCMIC